jgi:transcriptional regulator NrdR family protein
MLLCPDCKSENTYVMYTNPHDSGATRRRYECRACGRRFFTMEVAALDPVLNIVPPRSGRPRKVRADV